MYICLKCNQMFNIKPKEHGKAKSPERNEQEYFPCDGKLAVADLVGSRGKRKKVQLRFDLYVRDDQLD